ncbi:hypothetical protein [Streptomyces microflavus]|uniref:hypothetical protein n=1 Tax=Streptomyces microflavus TaxID=1919 RepID=UPI0036E94A59
MKSSLRKTVTAASACVLALVTLALPGAGNATAEDDHLDLGTPKDGVYCSNWEQFYGRGGYTRVEARPCLEVIQQQARAQVQTRNSQFKQFTGWASSDDQTISAWSARGKITESYWKKQKGLRSRHLVDYYVSLDHHQSSSLNSDGADGQSKRVISCDFKGYAYKVTFKFRQYGPRYNSPDYMIDPAERTHKIMLKCKP